MKLVLDSHVFIWLVEGDPRLSGAVAAAIADSENTLLLSIASVWKLAIKVGNKKLQLSLPLDRYLDHWLPHYNIEVLAIERRHALAVADLPQHHRDPFDRLIICQALSESLTIASADAVFTSYPVNLLW